jgi:hypothetical protein
MTGADVEPLRPGPLGKLYVVGMIADHKRAPQVNAMLLGRSVQEMGIGFDAIAAVAAVMGTDVRGGNLQPRLGQRRHHMGIDLLHLLQGHDPLGHAGLVGHEEEQKVLSKPAQGFDGARQETDFRGVRQVTAVFNQGSVSIEKYSVSFSLRTHDLRAIIKPLHNANCANKKPPPLCSAVSAFLFRPHLLPEDWCNPKTSSLPLHLPRNSSVPLQLGLHCNYFTKTGILRQGLAVFDTRCL